LHIRRFACIQGNAPGNRLIPPSDALLAKLKLGGVLLLANGQKTRVNPHKIVTRNERAIFALGSSPLQH
jgi:hypothetical protein